jgi:hypothetical protein
MKAANVTFPALLILALASIALAGCPDDKKGTAAAASGSAASTAPAASSAAPAKSGSGW